MPTNPTICQINWGSLADWLSFLAAAATAFIALRALGSWKAQLAGQTRHAVAIEIETAARALRYAFYDARSPLLAAAEFSEPYRTRRMGEQPTREDKASEYAFVYHNRLRALSPYIHECAKLRPKAGMTFSDDCADALESLAKKARELDFIASEYVEQIRVGTEVVSMWSDQEWASRVKNCIQVRPEKNDPLSIEFEAAMQNLTRLLRQSPVDRSHQTGKSA